MSTWLGKAPGKILWSEWMRKRFPNENFQLSCFDYTTRTGCSCEQYRCWRVVKAYFFPLHCLCLRMTTKEILRMENVVGWVGGGWMAWRRNNNLWQETTYIVSSHRCLSVACFRKSLVVCVIKSAIMWMAFEKLCLSLLCDSEFEIIDKTLKVNAPLFELLPSPRAEQARFAVWAKFRPFRLRGIIIWNHSISFSAKWLEMYLSLVINIILSRPSDSFSDFFVVWAIK